MRNPGHTLIEILVVLAILAVLLAVGLPGMSRWRNAAAVRAARDDLAAGLAWTRMAAVTHGGASLVLDPTTGRFTIGPEDGTDRPVVDLSGQYGVVIDPGTTRLVTFRYDALGIGRLTSRTIRVRRGDVEGGVTVSAYGRYRRW